MVPDVLVVCEGSKTEPTYFRAKARDLRVNVDVITGDEAGTDPRGIVRMAADVKTEATSADQPYRSVWAVFDRDEHASIDAALSTARSNDVNVGLSDPCFELWVLLHLEDYSTAYIDRASALGRVQSHIPGYTKAYNVYPDIKDHEPEAISLAARLRNHHQAVSGTEHGNPSTGMDRLAEELNALACTSTR